MNQQAASQPIAQAPAAGEVLGASTQTLPATGFDIYELMAIAGAILIMLGALVGIKKYESVRLNA